MSKTHKQNNAAAAPADGKAHFMQVVLDMLCKSPELLMVVADLNKTIQEKFGTKDPAYLFCFLVLKLFTLLSSLSCFLLSSAICFER